MVCISIGGNYLAGIFITFEGIDGAGKTTVINKVKEKLQEKQYKVFTTKEPIGFRDYFNKDMPKKAVFLNFAIDRVYNVEKYIIPNLNKEYIVMCDRFCDSSIVYQSFLGGLDIKDVEAINRFSSGGIEPVITFLLDVNVNEDYYYNRLTEEDRKNRSIKQYERLRNGYLKLASKHRHRISIIDANQPLEKVTLQVLNKIQKTINNISNSRRDSNESWSQIL